ncbi:sensor domain-containing protein [Ewingella americana]|uniref:diguanylate cyclase n=1 Tax=Ewingella americana TaxID=41202 RepID=A0A502G6H1_9GAMM|nr:GGDEF domain-containing phosphodiesterase [Ewingella americana]TPG57555.1 phosphodiesterase [Ewingella americana]
MFNNLKVCQSVLNALPEAVFLKDKYFRLVFLNHKASKLFGESPELLIGKKGLEHLGLPLASRILVQERHVLDTGEPVEFEEQVPGPDNQTRTFVIRASRIILNAESYLLISLSDISVLRQAEAHMRYLAYHDPLTGLYNRAAFNERLQNVLLPPTKSEQPGGVLMLFDMDGFKNVNDTWGHQAGDLMLCEFARQLSHSTPEDSVIARLGGDEFAVLLGSPFSQEEAESLCQKIVLNTRAPFILKGALPYVTVSVGMTIIMPSDITAGECLRKADTALYEAKRMGKSRYCVYSELLDAGWARKRKMKKALAMALLSGQGLDCAYQPLVRAKNGEIIGVEALARWDDPELGSVSPVQFIPLAEECGLIVPLGKFILKRACQEMLPWHDLSVSVNISPVQLCENDFASMILQLLAKEGFPPHRLELELTETAIMNSDTHSKEQLSILRQHGIRIALDDFGTGYSSLSLLKDIMVDSVKIDRSFVQFVTQLEGTAAIVTAVSLLGNQLGLQVIAEGVETDEQRDFLIDAGCSQLQGYLFARPLTKEKLAQLIATTDKNPTV